MRIIIIIIIITVLITLFNPDEETPDTFKLIIFYCEKQLKLVTNPHKQTEFYWPHIMGIAVMQIERRRQGRPGILRLSRKVDAAGNGNLTSIPW